MKKIFTSSPLTLDFGLLLLRVLLAAGLLTHGNAKIANFSALSTSFLDPLGIGVLPALLGAIFAEVVCSILVLIGLWTRLTVLPLIFTFIVVFFPDFSSNSYLQSLKVSEAQGFRAFLNKHLL